MKLLSVILLGTFFILMAVSSTAGNPIWTGIRWGLKPTCLGCSGLCEVRAPSGCACVKDYACEARLRQQG
ncbi:hypothetical protein I4U23_016702 [Adineta vaga]|nr:hypothetical protein I4U23_016702 [Adineta vaga]